MDLLGGLLPELTLIAGSFVILLAMARVDRGQPPATVAFVSLALASVFALAQLVDVPGLGFVPQSGTVLDVYEISVFAALLKLLFLLGTAIVVLASPGYMERTSIKAEYYAMLLMATLGMMIVASSQDMLTLFLGVEVTSFASYVLAGSFKTEPTSSEAATKYFITGALSSSLVIFGISLLYGSAGTLTFAGLADFWGAQVENYSSLGQPALYLFISQPIQAISVFLILAGLGFKLTVAPFHMWAPDAYTGAPDTVASWLGGVGKGLGVVAMLKVFLWALAPLASGWEPFVAGLAILTMTWGNLVAIRQDDIKRMLAYSSIAQAGYLLIVLPVGTSYAIAGGVFHTLTNILMKGGAFLVVAAFAYAGIGTKLQDYEGLGRRNPFLAVSLTVFLLSLAGLPPLGGFWSKFVLFSSAIDVGVGGGSWLWWLAVAGIVNSAISLFYYARWIRTMFVETTIHPQEVELPAGLTTAIAVSLVAIVAVGLAAGPVIDWSVQAGEALLTLAG
jgi:NADH-quinone oxidoreductase subunit N